jgi:energy-coupling factor transporter ATP-binding protein EcfA2
MSGMENVTPLSFWTWLLAFLMLGGVLLVTIVTFYRQYEANRVDKFRTLFQMHFPNDFPFASFLEFMRALHSLPKPRPLRPVMSVVLEIFGRGKDIRYYISIPDALISQVSSLFGAHIRDGMFVRPEEDLITGTVWEHMTEMRATSKHLPLYYASPEPAVNTLLSAFGQLNDDDRVMRQLVIVPRNNDDEPADGKTSSLWPELEQLRVKEKRKEPLFSATLRFATAGPRSRKLLYRLRGTLHSMDSRKLHLVRRLKPVRWVRDDIKRRSSPIVFPCEFNAVEAAIIASPMVDNTHIAGIPVSRSQPPHDVIPREGIVVAISDYPGLQRPLALSQRGLSTNVWITGPTDSGKSTLLKNMARQAMEQDMGLVLIESKGDLAREVANSVPKRRIKDVVWFDPADKDFPIGLNILDSPDPERTTGYVVSIFKKKYNDTWGPQLEQNLSHAVYTAAVGGLDLYGVKQLLINPELRSQVLRKIHDNDLKQFWRTYDGRSDIHATSVINKLDSFLRPKSIRNVVSQLGGLDMAAAVRDRRIIIMPLERAVLGEENAAVLGSLFAAHLWNHIQLRRESERYPVMFIVDEGQNYLGWGLDRVLAEARSYQFPIVFAHQHLHQLDKDTQAALKSNARTKITFAPVPEDASALADYYAPMTKHHLQALPQYAIAMRAYTDSGQAPTVTGRTLAPEEPSGTAEAIRRASRTMWGMPAADVEAAVEARYRLHVPEKRAPKVGWEDI